jgi:hypothetical protein
MIGKIIYLKKHYLELKKSNKLQDSKLPQFIKWLIQTSEFDEECFGKVIKINESDKLLVKFNKPIFINHPNKMDIDGYSVYLIRKVLTEENPYSTFMEKSWYKFENGIAISK